MLFDLIQNFQIANARSAADSAKSSLRDTRSEVQDLRSRVEQLERVLDRLSLVTLALTEIVEDRLQLPKSEIEDLIEKIDLRDGILNGKLNSRSSLRVKHCLHCNRGNSRKRDACLYCEEPLDMSEDE